MRPPASTSLEVEVRPPWPFRLPARDAPDGVLRCRGGVVSRYLHVDSEPVTVNAWQRRSGEVTFRADGRTREAMEVAIERMRFALGVDEDLRPFYERFRRDRLLGPAIRARPWLRPHRRPWPWEALAWAITAQLIEAVRAARIQRRIVDRWGPVAPASETAPAGGPGVLRDVPGPAAIAGCAPAELAALDLSPGRAALLVRVARDIAAGRTDPARAADDRRLLAIAGIGPWTVQCLGLDGRGEDDSLPAGDLAYIKLVGRLAGLGRRATVEEVEEFYAPYAPFRGLAGRFTVVHHHKAIAAGPPLRLAA